MYTFTVYTQNIDLLENIKTALLPNFKETIEIIHIGKPEEMEFHLFYEVPQFALFDLDNDALKAREMIKNISLDPWVMVGVLAFSNEREHPPMPGVFAILNSKEIGTLLNPFLNILVSHEKLLLQSGIIYTLGANGKIVFENKAELCKVFAELFSSILYNQFLVDSEKRYGLKVSLFEILLNSVEHGNCEISSKERERWAREGKGIELLIEEKCKNPEIANRRVFLTYELKETHSKFVIQDEGSGFDTSKFVNPDGLSGRGIMMTRFMVDEITYNEKGNEVTVVLKHNPNPEKISGMDWKSRQIIELEPEEILFYENQKGNDLYYIIDGNFDVIRKGKLVGYLDPTNLLLGEMAFLLGNRRSATIKAKTKARLIVVSAQEWKNSIQKHPHYSILLARLLAKKIMKQSRPYDSEIYSPIPSM